MPSREQLEILAKPFPDPARVLTDLETPSFKEHMIRWSEIGRKAPRAIVLPTSEDECQIIVKWAVSNNVPFAIKSGGMSLYSTIGEEGVIIDLNDFASVVHDESGQEALLTGGISSKAVAVELAKDGYCTTLPSSNPVGAIPFFLNGGNSPLVSLRSYGSDNIVSARMVSATGEIVNISERENNDLLYAIRGAGQYFGLVTSLTVRTYPVQEIFGNKEGSFWSGRFVFPLERVKEVARAMQSIVDNKTYCTGGLVMVAAPPPTFKPAVAVAAKMIHPESDLLQEIAFKPLYDLKPMMVVGGQLRIENNADALQPLSAPGDYKKLRLTGIHSYDPKHVVSYAKLWQDLASECPKHASMLSIQWESRSTPQPAFASANGMHGVRFWANNLIWCKGGGGRDIAERYSQKAHDIVIQGQQQDQLVDFTNSLREPDSRIENRYPGQDRLKELQWLKRQWDPEGVFSRELL